MRSGSSRRESSREAGEGQSGGGGSLGAGGETGGRRRPRREEGFQSLEREEKKEYVILSGEIRSGKEACRFVSRKEDEEGEHGMTAAELGGREDETGGF